MEYLEIIAQNGHIINFSYNNGRGAFTLDLNNALEMFTISDFKRFFAIADSSAEGSFAIAEKVQAFTAARLEYEKSFLNGTFSKNQKLIAKLEKILLFLSDSFGISCDVEKPEKITKKRGTGLIFNVDESGRRYAEAVTGDFYKVGGVWYFIHKKPEIKRGGYVLSAAAYGSRVAAFGFFKTAKDAIAWITENGISQKLLNPPSEGRARAAEMRARFLEAVENSGLSWVIESNPAYFEDFLTTAEAETPAERAEMPQNATESTTAAECTTEEEKSQTERATPTEATTPAKDPATLAAISDTDSTTAGTPTDTDTRTAGEAARITTAARTARQTAHKPHRPRKNTRGYISIIDNVKARHGSKYAPTMARPTPPHSMGLQKMGFPGVKKGNTDQSDKILQKSVKTRFGFCIGLSPPGGYQKFSL